MKMFNIVLSALKFQKEIKQSKRYKNPKQRIINLLPNPWCCLLVTDLLSELFAVVNVKRNIEDNSFHHT